MAPGHSLEGAAGTHRGAAPDLARLLGITPERIDLVDIPSARLAMRAVVAEEGLLLKGDNTLAWSHFLLRTWEELEESYRERRHAAC